MMLKRIMGALGLLFCGGVLAADAPVAQAGTLKVISYNVLSGFNGGKSVDVAVDWIKQQAPDVVLLQEMAYTDHVKLTAVAKRWGHDYAYVTKPNANYSTAITSRLPFELIESRVKGLHHGYVLAKVGGIYYMSIHLSPFQYKVRIEETKIVRDRLLPLIQAGEKIIVAGDFNNPSPFDREILEKNPDLGWGLNWSRKVDAKHAHVQNLRDGHFDFTCIEQLLSAGLADICATTMSSEEIAKLPEIRIDIALLSKNLTPAVVSALIDAENRKFYQKISDHYPLILTLDRAKL